MPQHVMSHLLQQEIDEIKKYILSQTFKAKEIMNVSEAALYMNLSPSYIYKLTHRRILPHSKPGSKVIYFKKSDLDEWMLSNKVPSIEERRNSTVPRRTISNRD